MPLDIREQVNDATGTRRTTGTALGVHWQRLDIVQFHRLPEFPFQKRLHQQDEEVDAKQRLNPANFLQIDRRDAEIGFQLRETLLNLTFVYFLHRPFGT